ncbi:hypothetical protein GCM10020256_66740 [Streptomyces thermocoprophilus]
MPLSAFTTAFHPGTVGCTPSPARGFPVVDGAAEAEAEDVSRGGRGAVVRAGEDQQRPGHRGGEHDRDGGGDSDHRRAPVPVGGRPGPL